MSARHVMIRASAGSGKTYALTSRFVRLLAEGAAPDRIVALTFTRKAAGEFFDEILNKLAGAAADPQKAERLARDIGQPALGPADFTRQLRRMVDEMPRLRLGTLDAFFAQIARSFPLELGLAGEFEVLEDYAAQRERRRVLQLMFARYGDELDAGQREFIEAFKRATFGAEEKRLVTLLDGYLEAYLETYLAATELEAWGSAARIWPRGCGWLEPASKPLAEHVEALRRLLEARHLPEAQMARWTAFFETLERWKPAAETPKPMEYLLRNGFAVWDDILRGSAEIVIERRKLALRPEECRHLAAILRHIVGAEYKRGLESTRGIFEVLRGFESHYHQAVRRSGKLTFGDLQRLLSPDVIEPVLSQSGGTASDAAERRLLIDFRLDGQIDHWLLDEFQDTSFGQWSVLRNLIDEAIQDPEGRRSFFVVGDVKQAIFTWRAGDPRLFGEIFERYTRVAPGTIEEQPLDRSWRSGPAIIETVNTLFGRAGVLEGMFPDAGAQWNREWRAHATERATLDGHAAWFVVDDEPARFALAARLIGEIDPLNRGLECAVLTQTNDMANRLADYLRRVTQMPVVAESDLSIATDNPLGAALLALLHAAAHPGDRLAQEHWRMTPLRDALAQAGITTNEALTLRLLGQVHREGFERTLEFWLRRVEGRLAPDDEFSRMRGRQFVAAAALFDATGSRDIADFMAFMERHVVRGTETSGVVRVMTIHKSKGLGFDVVVLPDLEGDRLDQRRSGLAVQRDANRAVEWVLDLPSRIFFERDPTLAEHVRAAEAEAGYEALSLLYVAMTRAKRAMYLITDRAPRSESRNYPKLLASALGDKEVRVPIGAEERPARWSAGNPRWHGALSRAEPVAEGGTPVRTVDPASVTRIVRREARRPSAEQPARVTAAQLFAWEESDAARFGTEVHAMLAGVDAGGAEAADRLAAEWRRKGGSPAAVDEALRCVRAAELAPLWRAPGAALDVWRERRFEILLDGAWVSGAFDRVLIEKGSDGRPRRALVIDFKTDRVGTASALAAATERHSLQIQLYRRVAAVLAGLPPTEVAAELVFTSQVRRVAVPHGLL